MGEGDHIIPPVFGDTHNNQGAKKVFKFNVFLYERSGKPSFASAALASVTLASQRRVKNVICSPHRKKQHIPKTLIPISRRWMASVAERNQPINSRVTVSAGPFGTRKATGHHKHDGEPLGNKFRAIGWVSGRGKERGKERKLSNSSWYGCLAENVFPPCAMSPPSPHLNLQAYARRFVFSKYQ